MCDLFGFETLVDKRHYRVTIFGDAKKDDEKTP